MRIHSFRIRNFRRLQDVRIDLDSNTTIFVGANNSGKTSATQVFQAFFGADGERGGFSVYDFSAECWGLFDRIGAGDLSSGASLPSIGLDVWFDVQGCDLHRVVELLPSLDWDDAQIGVRMEFAPRDADRLLENFGEIKAKSDSCFALMRPSHARVRRVAPTAGRVYASA